MAFDTYAVSQNTGKKQSNVDWDAYHEYIIETAQLQERETICGVISGLIDLGQQNLPDSEVVFNGSEEDEAKEIEKNSNTYFKDGYDPQTRKQARFKCWPNKPQQCVVLSVDFPDIQLNLGQFFGEADAEEKPLRMYLGGQFYVEGAGMLVARPIPLKINKSMGFWSFDAKHQLYKMAVASKLIKAGEAFLPQQIDKLLGKTLQFEVQIHNKPGKNDKNYFTEYIKFVSGLGRNMQAYDFEDTFMIQFNADNDLQDLKEVRAYVKNTMKRATNYVGSKVQQQIESLESQRSEDQPAQQDTDQEEEEKPVEAPKKPSTRSKKPPVEVDGGEDDLPF